MSGWGLAKMNVHNSKTQAWGILIFRAQNEKKEDYIFRKVK